jgi:hypothetical protein
MSQFGSAAERPSSPEVTPWGAAADAAQAFAAEDAPRASLLERLGLAALVAVMAATAVALGIVLAQQRLDSESLSVSDRLIDVVSLRWDEGALLSVATPHLAAQSPDRLDPLFATLKTIAAYASNQGCRGGATIGFRGMSDPLISAAYTCALEAEGRRFDVDLRLNKFDGVWKVDGFLVRPTPRSLAGAP